MQDGQVNVVAWEYIFDRHFGLWASNVNTKDIAKIPGVAAVFNSSFKKDYCEIIFDPRFDFNVVYKNIENYCKERANK